MPRLKGVLPQHVPAKSLPLAQASESTPVAVNVMLSVVRYIPAMNVGAVPTLPKSQKFSRAASLVYSRPFVRSAAAPFTFLLAAEFHSVVVWPVVTSRYIADGLVVVGVVVPKTSCADASDGANSDPPSAQTDAQAIEQIRMRLPLPGGEKN